MNYEELHDEIANDPLGRGYVDMTDAEIATDLNTEYRERNRAFLSGDEIFQATVDTEFGALTDHEQDLWLSFCARNKVDPFGAANVAFVQHIFGATSDTVTALGNLRVESISRAEELELGTVTEHDVAVAKETI